MEILDPISILENEKKDKELIMKKVNKTIEQLILRDPSQWILTHNRWKQFKFNYFSFSNLCFTSIGEKYASCRSTF